MENQIPVLSTNLLYSGYKTGVNKQFTVLNQLNLSARQGSLIALLGINGSGKSTLLMTLGGLLPPLSGEVMMEGRNIHQLSAMEIARKLSFVAAKPVYVNYMSCYELVALGRYPYLDLTGHLSKSDHRVIRESFELTHTAGLMNRKINQLSDGQRQRIMIARALAQDTPVLLLDEPTSHLDQLNRYEIIHVLRKLAHDKKKTIIFSTHDLGLSMQFADNIWLINDSQIVEGAPEDLTWKGFLSNVFDNSYFKIDNITGDFIPLPNYKISVKIQVSGRWSALVEKFCNRMNCCIAEDAPLLIKDKPMEDKPVFEVHFHNKVNDAEGFYELSRILMKLTDQHEI